MLQGASAVVVFAAAAAASPQFCYSKTSATCEELQCLPVVSTAGCSPVTANFAGATYYTKFTSDAGKVTLQAFTDNKCTVPFGAVDAAFDQCQTNVLLASLALNLPGEASPVTIKSFVAQDTVVIDPTTNAPVPTTDAPKPTTEAPKPTTTTTANADAPKTTTSADAAKTTTEAAKPDTTTTEATKPTGQVPVEPSVRANPVEEMITPQKKVAQLANSGVAAAPTIFAVVAALVAVLIN